MRKKLQSEKGFTLIEMSIVLFIISILLLLFIPNLSVKQGEATETGGSAIVVVLQSQVDMYTMDKGGAPASFDVMVGDYLTASQLEKANAGFTLSGGTVSEKTSEE